MRRAYFGFVDICTFVGGVSLIAMMLHITLDVAMKYAFNSPVPATLETVSYYYMAGVAFLPLAGLERHDALIHVELFYEKLPEGVRWLVLALALLLAAGYCGAAAWAAVKPAMHAYDVGAYTVGLVALITWPTRFLPIIGFGLLATVLLWKLALHLRHPWKVVAGEGTEGAQAGPDEGV
jgi:TRAP-type C4-dicarboxylate transport system permease small subunit